MLGRDYGKRHQQSQSGCKDESVLGLQQFSIVVISHVGEEANVFCQSKSLSRDLGNVKMYSQRIESLCKLAQILVHLANTSVEYAKL